MQVFAAIKKNLRTLWNKTLRLLKSFPRLSWKNFLIIAAVVLIFTLYKCGQFPSAGPSLYSFSENVVEVNVKVIETLSSIEDASHSDGEFVDRSNPIELVIGIGDVVRVRVFEAASGGLFVPPSGSTNSGSKGNFVDIADQEVDQRGVISIPYADKDGDGGLIKVSGRTTVEVQIDIQQRLMNRAIEPQVIVTIPKRISDSYSVIGKVAQQGQFSVSTGGTRILDALTKAGWAKGEDYKMLVTLLRDRSSVTIRLSTLLTKPDNNVFVQPGDLIILNEEERYYNVIGATSINQRVAFDSEKITVADAIAKAGGLKEDVADAGGVFVMRYEKRKTLESMGITEKKSKDESLIQTSYRLDFSKPSGLLFANQFTLRDGDILYVSSNLLAKMMGIYRHIKSIGS